MVRKVAIVIERADISLGGAERSVFELAGALSRAGLAVDIVAAKGNSQAEHIHSLCEGISGRRVCLPRFGRALRRHLREHRYDIVHSVLPFGFADVYQPRGGTVTETIRRNAASYRNRLVESYKRCTAFVNVRRLLLLRAERRLCADADGPVVAALSEYVARQFREHYRLSNSRLCVIPNGIKTDEQVEMDVAAKLRGQIRQKLGIGPGERPVLFLFAANNFRLKGLRACIEALSLLSRRGMGRSVFLVVAGRCRPRRYRQMARRLGVKNLIFLSPVRRIQNLLSIIDVAVLPTFYDPSSRFILEAIAAGRPVITTRYNGACDAFVDGRHGRAIDSPQAVGELAEAMAYLGRRENVERASRAIASDNLKEQICIGRAAEQLRNLYESIGEQRSRKCGG